MLFLLVDLGGLQVLNEGTFEAAEAANSAELFAAALLLVSVVDALVDILIIECNSRDDLDNVPPPTPPVPVVLRDDGCLNEY